AFEDAQVHLAVDRPGADRAGAAGRPFHPPVSSPMRLAIPAALLSGLVATPSLAADLNVTLTIPTLKVAEYHRPYVAVWIEKPDQSAVKTLAVWYDTKLAKREGETWLKDMRQWWRRAGRETKMPVDGVSGATRAPGKHQ